MKLYKYLNKISKETDTILRSVSFDIVESSKDNEIHEIVKDDPRFNTVYILLNELNSLLKRNYRGTKYKFDLCFETSSNIQKMNITDKDKQMIKKRWLDYNSKLSDIQYNIEKEMAS